MTTTLDHIDAALASIEAKNAPDARRHVADARRALGQWTSRHRAKTLADIPSLPELSPREHLADWLLLADDALQGDTWPGDEPHYITEFYQIGCDEGEALGYDVEAWLRDHRTIGVPRARLYLLSARSLCEEVARG